MLLALVDYIFARHTKARWPVIHAAGNFAVSLASLEDVFASVRDPIGSCSSAPPNGDRISYFPLYMIAAVHLYHCLAFSNLSRSDWIHHVAFGGIICSVGLLTRTGPLQNLLAFFTLL